MKEQSDYVKKGTLDILGIKPESRGKQREETSGHASGPWAISYVGSTAQVFGGAISDNNGNQVALVTVTRNGSQEERDANANLIAAAPDLLEACKLALTELEGMGAVDGIGDAVEADEDVLKQIRTVITKAEGLSAKEPSRD